MKRPTALLPRLLVIASLAAVLIFLISAPRSLAATTHNVSVGGEVTGVPFAKVAWFNGFDPGTIIIQAGDTVVWHLVGGVHTVTSADLASDGSFLFDSSPLFTTTGALADMGPGLLLPPGSVWELDTSTLALGTYTYICKIHPGMMGNLTITAGPATSPVTIIAGWGDTQYAALAFSPENVAVPQGTIVRWTLLNPIEPHTITHLNTTTPRAFDSSPLFNPPGPPPVMPFTGVTFSYTFNNVGTYTYFCKVHAYKVGASWVGMVGTVIVQPVPVVPISPSDTLAAISYVALGVAGLSFLVAMYSVVRRKPGSP